MRRKGIGFGCLVFILIGIVLANSREFGWIFEYIWLFCVALITVPFAILSNAVDSEPEIYARGEANVVATYPTAADETGGEVVVEYADHEGRRRKQIIMVAGERSFRSLPIGAVRKIEICTLDPAIIRSDQFKHRGKDPCYELNAAKKSAADMGQ